MGILLFLRKWKEGIQNTEELAFCEKTRVTKTLYWYGVLEGMYYDKITLLWDYN